MLVALIALAVAFNFTDTSSDDDADDDETKSVGTTQVDLPLLPSSRSLSHRRSSSSPPCSSTSEDTKLALVLSLGCSFQKSFPSRSEGKRLLLLSKRISFGM